MSRFLVVTLAALATTFLGACKSEVCLSGSTDCGGVCVELGADNLNCGACGNPCDAGEVCSVGVCALTCQAGLTDCAGSCRDLQTDVANCGACGNPCDAGEVCSAGVCGLSCQAGLTNCSGTCRDLQTDVANCGACGNPCNAGEVCSAGICSLSCQAGLTNCSGTCRDLQTDIANCGACGNPCSLLEVCDQGTCELPFCRTVNGVRWCYNPMACGEPCDTVCASLGLPLTISDVDWFAAQDTTAECQAISQAFGMGSAVGLSSYTYACMEDTRATHSVYGGLVGPLLCSSYSGCPAGHRTNMDQIGVPCGPDSRRSLCPCQ